MSVVHADRAIAKRLLSGDERAFQELFDSFFPRLYRFALARLDGDRDEAADIVQQTFCRAFDRLDSYRAEASLYGWMCQICRNAITDLGRRKQRELRQVKLLEEDTSVQGILETISAPSSDEPEHQVSRMEVLRLIQATLDCLPGHYGDVLEWKYVEGMSVKEIAGELGIGPKAAESLLTRARNAFREAIETISDSSDVFPIHTEGLAKG